LADSPEATLLRRRARRRLVGAIALVVFVVVVLPLVLDQEQKPTTQTLTVQIPSQNGSPFTAPVVPPVPPSSAPSTKSEPPSTPEEKSKAATTESRSAPQTGRARAAKGNGAEAETKETPRRLAEARRAEALLNDAAYFVPLGAFANPDNARQVQDKATGAGIGSYTEKVKTRQGEQTRVRAGPFSSKEAAGKARETLRSIGLTVGQVTKR
jgi:DedD protein